MTTQLKIIGLKPSVCIDAVYEGVPIEKSISAISQLGFNAFEFWCWWEKDLEQIRQLCDQFEMSIAAFCTKFISLTDPDLRNEYLDGLSQSIEAATSLNCRTLISQVGDYRQDVSRETQHESLVTGLRKAAELLEKTDITLVIEPLNVLVDHPGYFLIESKEAFDVVAAVDSDHVKIVFDIYHQQISEGNLLSNILPNIERIGHFHAAGNPGRHELDSGELSYPAIFNEIADAGFDGYVGLEYWPLKAPENGLKRVADWF